jgi:hypothetical protein
MKTSAVLPAATIATIGAGSAIAGSTAASLRAAKRGSDRHVTYNGHNVRRDAKAGQVSGEGLKLNGKLWYAVRPWGTAMIASKVDSSSSGSSTSSGW